VSPHCGCRGAPRKYLDSLLSASRLELFRPGVDLLAAGDAVNELFIVVAGRVELRWVPSRPAVCCQQGSCHMVLQILSLGSLSC
jgi:hypothetical protein